MRREVPTRPVFTQSERSAANPPRAPRPLALRSLHRAWRRTLDELEVTHVALPVRGLPPALESLVACQISDFHLDRDEDLARLACAVELINRQKPDLVFLTGDYFSGPDTMRRYLRAFSAALSDLAPASGTFAVAGNHDHWSSFAAVAEALQGARVRLLTNASHALKFRGEKLTVVGIDDLWSRRAEPSRAFRNVHSGECTIVLAHNPDTALYTRHLAPGVMLCGHTHGGVVRLPFYGSPLRSMLKIGRRFYAGLNRYEGFYIYTNRGLGTYWLRIRINCRPEISRFGLTPLTEAETGEATIVEADSDAAARAMRARAPRRSHPRLVRPHR